MSIPQFLFSTVIIPWIQAAVMVALPIVFTWGIAVLKKHNRDTRWYEAIGRAGGAAYNALLASGLPFNDPRAQKLAAEAGAQYLITRVPELMAARGRTPADAVQISHAEMGTLLARDPTVGPPAAPVQP